MRKKWRLGVPLYFSGVVVMALALFLHALIDRSPDNVPFIVGAVGLVLTAAGQATKDGETKNKGSDGQTSLEPLIDLLRQLGSEARGIRRVLKKDVVVPRNTQKFIVLAVLISALTILLRRRR